RRPRRHEGRRRVRDRGARVSPALAQPAGRRAVCGALRDDRVVSRIAIALAGYGKIARDQHERAIAGSEDFTLVAIGDPAARHSSLPSYDSLAAMLRAHPP